MTVEERIQSIQKLTYAYGWVSVKTYGDVVSDDYEVIIMYRKRVGLTQLLDLENTITAATLLPVSVATSGEVNGHLKLTLFRKEIVLSVW